MRDRQSRLDAAVALVTGLITDLVIGGAVGYAAVTLVMTDDAPPGSGPGPAIVAAGVRIAAVLTGGAAGAVLGALAGIVVSWHRDRRSINSGPGLRAR